MRTHSTAAARRELERVEREQAAKGGPEEQHGQVMAELHALRGDVSTVRELLRALEEDAGFYTPEEVYERSTLSPTEIARRQQEGRFPKYTSLGQSKRGMFKPALRRWVHLQVRGKDWTPDEDAIFQVVESGDAARARRARPGAVEGADLGTSEAAAE